MIVPKKGLIYILFGLYLVGCTKSGKETLTIATAANMQFAMEALTAAFTQQTGIPCQTAVSSSGKLTAQIEEGAPFDLFISADMKYPNNLYEKGLTAEAPEVYAYGQLVLWSMISNLEPSLQLLSGEAVRHIALANPINAPYGVAATEVLEHFQLLPLLQDKLVYGESIAQTNQFIISKAAEVGFTAKSVVLSPRMKDQGRWVDLDAAIYTPIAQGAVILDRSGSRQEAARQFYDFLFSTSGREILVRFGYEVGPVDGHYLN